MERLYVPILLFLSDSVIVRIIALLLICLQWACVSSQNANEPPSECAIYESLPDVPAEVVGGFYTISKRLHYPESALSQKIGGTVNLALFVNEKGQIVTVEVTKRVHPALDEEAVRVAKTLPMIPANHKGNVVCSRLPLPIIFSPPR